MWFKIRSRWKVIVNNGEKIFSFHREREQLDHMSYSVALTCLHNATFTGLHCLNWDPKGEVCLNREHENDV